MKNRSTVAFNIVVHEVNNTLHCLAKVRYLWLSHIPFLWPGMVKFFKDYKPYIVTRRVTWGFPH